jgi:uncharacterized SAM-binding protein YcdF (DUF218 family)
MTMHIPGRPPPQRTKGNSDTTKRRSYRWVGVAALVLLVAFGATTAHLFIWPHLQPLPRHVDAIIELGGAANDRRDRVAVELAREGRADYLVQSTTRGEAGRDTCLPAVPSVTVLCFHADPNSTRGEAQWVAAEADRRGWESVILVTTPDQAWRASLRTTRCFPGDVYVATAPLPAVEWLWQIPYQWAASAKALTIERSC